MNTLVAPGAMSSDIDLLIRPEWIIPIEPAGVTLAGHSLAVNSGCIAALLPDKEALQRFRPRQTIDLPGQVLLPGLINLHTHAAMSLLRGYADDLPLMRWLSERIWPAETRHATPDFVQAGSLLACAEMLRGGITTFNDCISFPRLPPLRPDDWGYVRSSASSPSSSRPAMPPMPTTIWPGAWKPGMP